MKKGLCVLDDLAKTAIETQDWAFIDRNVDNIDWYTLSERIRLPLMQLNHISSYFNWKRISSAYELSISEIRFFADQLDWTELTHTRAWSAELIHEFSYRLDWAVLSVHQILPLKLYEMYEDKIHWDSLITMLSGWPDEFITRFRHKFSPHLLSALTPPDKYEYSH